MQSIVGDWRIYLKDNIMIHKVQRTFSAELDRLREMIGFIQEFGQEQNIPSSILSHIILAAEEALVNIIKYGYPKNKGTIDISCEPCKGKQSGVKIVIKDKGIPFNPVKKLEVSPPLTPEMILMNKEKVVGGYGIYIFVGMMDRVEYQRADRGNILTLIKFL